MPASAYGPGPEQLGAVRVHRLGLGKSRGVRFQSKDRLVQLPAAGLGPGASPRVPRGRGLRFDDLRHTCVSRLVAGGADIKLVQAVAGQAYPLITLKRYSHVLDARVTEAAQRFDPARVP
jgi:integrase